MRTFVLFRLLAVVALIFMTHSVYAKQSDSLVEKVEQLAKTADANRQDWQAQFDAGCCYLDTMFSASEYMQAETYLRRALDIALAQEVKRDTILGKTLMAMSSLYARRNNHKEMLEYHHKAVEAYANELGLSDVCIPSHIANLASEIIVLCMGKPGSGADIVDAIKLLRGALHLYHQIPEEQQTSSGEDIETASALAYELFLTEQLNLMKDKVWLWTDNGNNKKYIVLAFDNWTLEYPVGFLATLQYNVQNNRHASDRKRGIIRMDEQGNVVELEHGEIDFNYIYEMDGNNFTLNKNNTFRLIRVTPERLKELIDALHTFEQKKQNRLRD